MRLQYDLTGQTFSRLTVVSHVGSGKWHTRCECGNETIVMSEKLRNGSTKSCGCYRDGRLITHGMRKTPAYSTWSCMIQRCTNPNNTGYDNYGGRGITICDEWQSFEGFHKSMGDRPEGTSIDRINNNGNYTPDNCKWSTRSEQSANSRMSAANTTGYLGVQPSGRNWMMGIRWRGKDYNKFGFKTKVEAAQARNNYIRSEGLPHTLSII